MAEVNLTLYHGTPHDFTSFSTKKINSGGGKQSFGWGLYFTNDKDVAIFYAKALSKNNIAYLYTVTFEGGEFLEWEHGYDEEFRIKFINKINECGYDKMPIKIDDKIIHITIENGLYELYDIKHIYESLLLLFNNHKRVVEFLTSLGYVGIKYPTERIQSVYDKRFNYVIFNDDKIKIVNKEKIQIV